MAVVRTSAPAVPPVTLGDAKAHLRVGGTDEDTLIASLIGTAAAHIERGFGLALITQGVKVIRDAWPATWLVELPVSPAQEVASVTTFDANGASAIFDPVNYFTDTASLPPRLVLHGAAPWPKPGRRANGIEIALTAGFGNAPADVPEPVRQAVLLLVAHWFEQREPVVLEDEPFEVPATVAALLAPYRIARL